MSPDAAATGAEQKKAIAEAFQIAAAGGGALGPADWLESTCPERWSGSGGSARYRWCGAEGADAFAG